MDLTKRLRKVVGHMPGFYDLLPFYRCVDESMTAHWLQPGDNEDLEGDSGLATESLDRHNRLIAGDTCGTSCQVFDALIRWQVAWPPLQRLDGFVTASADLPEPEVYRVEVKGGASTVTEQVMAVAPGDYR